MLTFATEDLKLALSPSRHPSRIILCKAGAHPSGVPYGKLFNGKDYDSVKLIVNNTLASVLRNKTNAGHKNLIVQGGQYYKTFYHGNLLLFHGNTLIMCY